MKFHSKFIRILFLNILPCDWKLPEANYLLFMDYTWFLIKLIFLWQMLILKGHFSFQFISISGTIMITVIWTIKIFSSKSFHYAFIEKQARQDFDKANPIECIYIRSLELSIPCKKVIKNLDSLYSKESDAICINIAAIISCW